MENRQTAVQWLVRMLYSPICDGFKGGTREIPYYIIQQAKAMEKEQIRDAYCKGVNDAENQIEGEFIQWEPYYNETYGN